MIKKYYYKTNLNTKYIKNIYYIKYYNLLSLRLLQLVFTVL